MRCDAQQSPAFLALPDLDRIQCLICDIKRDRFLRCIREAALDCERNNRWQYAVEAYQSGLKLDSLSEELYRGLTVCHRELGDYGEAMHAYRRCRETMTRFLGIPPNPKTLAVYHSVRERAACAQP